MKFKVPHVDLRSQMTGSTAVQDDTGRTVGQLIYGHGDGAERTVSLFGKYGGRFKSHDECVAFADGVAAVLSHMIKVELK